MFAVHRHDLIRPGRGQHQRSPGDERLLVGQRQSGTGSQRRQRRPESERSDHGVEHHVCAGRLDQVAHGIWTRQDAGRPGDGLDACGSIRIGDGDRRAGELPLTDLLREQVDVAATGAEAGHGESVTVG